MRLSVVPLTVGSLLLAACAGSTAREAPPVAAPAILETEVRAAAAEFVSAFNALDQARFDALWAEDATVFFPRPPFPIRRVEGGTEVLSWFKKFMDAERKGGDSPGVDPKELHVQLVGRDAAIVSFHLGSDPKAVSRRTLIYRRDPGGWRIVHLHGSALTAAK